MKILHWFGSAFAAAALLAATMASAAAPPVPAFTAHYRLLQNGSPIGTATLTLVRNADGTWTFTTQSRGTAGLAALLGASVRETSRFRWVGGMPQGESYDYSMNTGIKQKHRQVRFDWASHTVDVDDNGTFHFPTQPGAMERHTVTLALAAGLAAGKSDFTLPVAVRDRIEMQHYAAHGKQSLNVPAGTFDTIRVSRIDGGDGFEAWFAPAKLPVPVKIDRPSKQHFALELENWKLGN